MRTRLITLIIFILAACTPRLIPVPDPTQFAMSKPLSGITSKESGTPDRIDALATKMPERFPPTQVITPLTGEVPTEILDSILKDLSGLTGATSEQISVIQAQEIIWNDGSLGCPKSGVLYTQALVNGYWFILKINDKKYDYRASNTGYFFLCENGIPPISNPSTPSS